MQGFSGCGCLKQSNFTLVNCHNTGKHRFINLVNLALLKLLANLAMGLARACQQQNPRCFFDLGDAHMQTPFYPAIDEVVIIYKWRKNIKYNVCNQQLTVLNKDIEWLNIVDKFALYNLLNNLKIAYKNFSIT